MNVDRKIDFESLPLIVALNTNNGTTCTKNASTFKWLRCVYNGERVDKLLRGCLWRENILGYFACQRRAMKKYLMLYCVQMS